MTYETVTQLLTYVEDDSTQTKRSHLIWSLKWFNDLTMNVSFWPRLLMRSTCQKHAMQLLITH